MLAGRGEATAPCGVPTFVSDQVPSSDTPAFSHFWISRSILGSATRCGRNFSSHSWPVFQPLLVLCPRNTIHSGSGLPLQGVKAFPEQRDRNVVQQRGEPFLLVYPGSLTHAAQSLGHAFPALGQA